MPTIRLLLALLFVAPSALAGDDLPKKDKNPLQLYTEAHSEAELDEEAALKIPAREIELPWGKVSFKGGWLIPTKPKELDEDDLEGKDVPERTYISAVYVGEGDFEYAPPHAAENWLMNYSLAELAKPGNTDDHDLDKLEVSMKDGATFYFGSYYRKLLTEGATPGSPDKKTLKTAKKLWNGHAEAARRTIPFELGEAWDTFQGVESKSITIDVPTKDIKGGPAVTYFIDPGDIEPVQLYVLKRNPLNRKDISFTKLGQWMMPEDSAGKTDRELGYMRMKKDFDVKHYDFNLTMYRDEDEGRYGLAIDGSIKIGVNTPTKVLRMDLMSTDYKVTRLTDADGGRLDYVHKKGRLMVTLPTPLDAGEEVTINISVQGLIVQTVLQQEVQGNLTQQSAVGGVKVVNYRLPIGAAWFPTTGGFEDAFTFDWTLQMPKEMVAATSGTLVESRVEGDQRIMVVKEPVPVFFPAIVFGRFVEAVRPADPERNIPVIRLYVHPGFEKESQLWLDEAAGVIDFYQHLFGPYPWNELDMVQMPVGVGYAQAPSGLVQMDGVTFYSKTDLVNLFQADENLLDIRDNFVPHEIGHFWWGHRAGWAHGRDQWLSETLAEYSASLYIEEREKMRNEDPNDLSGYEHRKERWGKLGRLGHTFKRTGPVWIGNDTGSRRTSSIYARGPLVFDMLRENFGKEFVLKLLFTLNQVWMKNDNKAVTEDLQLVLEQLMPGVAFEQFMNDYVKGNTPLPDDPNKAKAEGMGKNKF